MNTQVKLAVRPEGFPTDATWTIEKNEIPTAGENEMVVQNHYLSIDPAMRGWLMDRKSYLPPVQVGEVMRALGVGQVVESNIAKFPVGSYVSGAGGIQQYSLTNGKGWFQVDPNLVPLPVYTSAMGMTGFTAYFGLLDVGQPKEGETVLVSGAAGAVGSMVGQIAKLKGCHVVGIAGSDEKCDYVVNELGFDACINYKTENVFKGIKTHCPKGVDVYFDNVGGDILDYALANLAFKARVVLCGAISQYNAIDPAGPKFYLSLLTNRARMEGFVVIDYAHRYQEAAQEMGKWLMSGKLKTKEHIEKGIENYQATFMKLFNGDKKGKLILQVNEA
jgi:NADPH-dependent curcumin reductase CurA